MKRLKKKMPATPPLKPIVEEPAKVGYEEFKSILSYQVEIRFSVPDREWNKLRESKEWTEFQALLEKTQKEYDPKQHQAAEWPKEFEDYM